MHSIEIDRKLSSLDSQFSEGGASGDDVTTMTVTVTRVVIPQPADPSAQPQMHLQIGNPEIDGRVVGRRSTKSLKGGRDADREYSKSGIVRDRLKQDFMITCLDLDFVRTVPEAVCVIAVEHLVREEFVCQVDALFRAQHLARLPDYALWNRIMISPRSPLDLPLDGNGNAEQNRRLCDRLDLFGRAGQKASPFLPCSLLRVDWRRHLP